MRKFLKWLSAPEVTWDRYRHTIEGTGIEYECWTFVCVNWRLCGLGPRNIYYDGEHRWFECVLFTVSWGYDGGPVR